MKKPIIVFIVAMSVISVSCQHTKNIAKVEKPNAIAVESQKGTKMTGIAFTIAKNYFVRNDAGKLQNPKIETAEEFNRIFGMATTMGKNGKPTSINFAKQYVITVLLPETNLATTIEPVSLQKSETGVIMLTYRTVIGTEQSYTTRPNLVLVVEKTVKGSVTLNAI